MVELVGGPLDGEILPAAPGKVPSLVWVKAKSRHAAGERLLYKATTSVEPGRTVWLWCGDVLTPCNCGTWHSRRDGDGLLLSRCSLCGSDLP